MWKKRYLEARFFELKGFPVLHKNHDKVQTGTMKDKEE